MIEDLDEVLRQLLIREIPIKNGEVDIQFDQPGREWSARISRPTLDLFLYDVRENQKLRQAMPVWETTANPDGTVTQRRKPVRADLHYMITAWVKDHVEDEHRLLSRTLMALFRFPHLPPELLPESLHAQPRPIPMLVAQYDELRNPTDVWQVLDNEMRPGIACVLTLALDPYRPITGPVVRTRELRIGQAQAPAYLQQLDEQAGQHVFWTIGGTLRRDGQPLDEVSLTLIEQGRDIPLQPDGRFVVGHLLEGEYTLQATVQGDKPRQFPIAVPSPDYDLDLEA